MTAASNLGRLADGCLLPGFDGTVAPDWVRRRVAGGLGGVVLFARNVASPVQVAALTAALRAERAEVLVGIDEEGGDVTRLEAATGSSYPGNLALGAAGDVALTRAVGESIGAELATVGVNLNLAPVADVNSNPANPVIGVRSFGADPLEVAGHVVAMVEGLQSAGVAACVKHFPGHGDTAVDSHLDLPVVDRDAAGLAAVELVPFRAAIRAGVRAVMTAHLLVPAYDTANPATLSGRIITGLLRHELGFDGLVVTDGLEMHAISRTVGLAEGAVRALAAGADALCVGGGLCDEGTVDLLRDAIVAAVHEGRLPEARLAEAAGRVDGTGAWAATARPPSAGHLPVDRAVNPFTEPAGGFHAEGGRVAGLVAARRAIVADTAAGVGPGALVIELDAAANFAAGVVPWGIGAVLGALDPTVETVRCPGPSADPTLAAGPDPASLARRSAGRPLILVVRDLHRHDWQQEVAGKLLARRRDAVVVEMGLPVLRPKGAAAWVRTYGAAHANAVAAAELLLRERIQQ